MRLPATPDLAAAYRLHGNNMSADDGAMLQAALEVHARHRPDSTAGPRALSAWREGRRAWREYYGQELASKRYRSHGSSTVQSIGQLAALARVAPAVAARETVRGVKHRIVRQSASLGPRAYVAMVGEPPGQRPCQRR